MLLRDNPGRDQPESRRSVLSLVEELLSQTARFLDQRLMLLRLEVEDSLGTLMRHLAIVLVGGALAGLGLVLSSVALALWIGSQVGSTVAGYAVTGAGFLVAGAILVAVRLRLGIGRPRRSAAPHAARELEKHATWLKSEL